MVKKIIPIIMGETIPPKTKPNLIQILFRGVSRYGFNIAKIKKIKLVIKAHTLISSSFNNGQKDIIKKKIKKIMPKLLFVEEFFMKIYSITLFFFNSKNFLRVYLDNNFTPSSE